MFEIVFHDRARKQYERLPARAARLLDRALPVLETDPFSGPNIRRLHGELNGPELGVLGEFLRDDLVQ